MSKVNPSEYSIIAWIISNGFKSEKGEALDFKDRLFLLPILSDWSKNIVIKKCSQVGGSVIFNIKLLFALSKLRQNLIYTFPTETDVNEFVSSKTNKLIEQNRHIPELKTLSTDNVQRKEINGRFAFFKGTISKTAAIMTTADIRIHDEASRSDQKVLEMYESRTKASEYGAYWMFSNPTTEKDLLDQEWQKSDKKEWHIICPHCKLKQFLTFPDNLDLKTKEFVCFSCKGVIDNETRRKGFWEATVPNSTISGYHISHLMCPWISATQIIEDSEKDQEYFYNFVLGEPYNPGDLSVSRSTILDIWTPHKLETGKYFLGVDVGNIKHYCLGSEKGVIKIGTFREWHELDDMLDFYKPIMVIDAMPENNMSKYYVEKRQNCFMCYLNRDKEKNRIITWGDGDDIGIIHADRNRALDQLISAMLNAEFLINITADKNLREFIKHWETMRRVKVIDGMGIERYVWESTTSVDHYCFALLFWYIAKSTIGSGIMIDMDNKQVPAIIHKSTGDYNNIGEMLEELNLQ